MDSDNVSDMASPHPILRVDPNGFAVADTTWLTKAPLAGIISCMDFSPDDPNMMAAGSYSSVAAVYDVASGSPALILSGHRGGLTQVCPISAAPFAVYVALALVP